MKRLVKNPNTHPPKKKAETKKPPRVRRAKRKINNPAGDRFLSALAAAAIIAVALAATLTVFSLYSAKGGEGPQILAENPVISSEEIAVENQGGAKPGTLENSSPPPAPATAPVTEGQRPA